MEYPFIKSVVPSGEHFDSSAVGEGVWLSVQHLAATEARGSLLVAEALQHTTTLNAVKVDLDAANANVASAAAKANTDATTIGTQATRIQELETQVTELGKIPSGSGSALNTVTDPPIEPVVVAAYASDDSPENVWADKQMRRKKVA